MCDVMIKNDLAYENKIVKQSSLANLTYHQLSMVVQEGE